MFSLPQIDSKLIDFLVQNSCEAFLHLGICFDNRSRGEGIRVPSLADHCAVEKALNVEERLFAMHKEGPKGTSLAP